MIYFDNAATTFTKPRAVCFAVQNVIRNFSANPGRSGHSLALDAASKVYECRRKLAKFFNCSKEENVVFTLNGTMSLNMAIKGVARKGDHFIISCLEHNASARPVAELKNRGIIDYDIAKVFEDDEKTVKSFERLIKKNTRAIVCTHVSNVFGNILPIEKIGQLARERGIIFIVDAAQSAGILPIDVKMMNIDFLCMPAHKGLFAPMGLGVLIVCSDDIPLETVIEGGTGSASSSLAQPDFLPDRLESGTVNLPAIAGLSAGLDFIYSVGINNILSHEEKIIRYLYDEFSKMEGVVLYTPEPKYPFFAPLLSLNIEGMGSDAAAHLLDEDGIAVRAGLHCAPLAHNHYDTAVSGTVRLSPSVFNTLEQAKYIVRSVKKIKKYAI